MRIKIHCPDLFEYLPVPKPIFILLQVAQYISSQKADAYVIVYSVEDRESFEGAVDRLYTIRNDDPRSVAVILVANKMDLVRNRIVQDDGTNSTLYMW